MATYYSLDNAISSFFEVNTTATRQQCDDFVLSRAGGPVNPVQIQGMFSYTLTAGIDESKLFQFRVQDSILDMDIMTLAKATHSQFVASCKYHGIIGQSRPLHIYEMDNLPGTTYIMARDISVIQPPDAVLRQRNTVSDLARYVQMLAALIQAGAKRWTDFSLSHGMEVNSCPQTIPLPCSASSASS
jgi:hypothetical protein